MFLNTNTTQDPDFTFTNTFGMDLILLGSLTNFTVYDQVPATLKPQYDGGPSNEEGIKVQGGTNATLVIDAREFNNDTLFEVKESSYVQVTDRSPINFVRSFSHFGSGVSHLEILTNEVDAIGFRAGGIDDPNHANWLPGEGTNVLVDGLPAGIDVKVDTGQGTYDRLVFGRGNSITEQATVLSGAGNDEVNVQEGNGDDGSDVLVDFVYADQLGLGNVLNVFSVGTAHLDNAPETSNHPIYVDTVYISGAGSTERGSVVVDHAATIASAEVQDWGRLTNVADGTTITTLLVHNNGQLFARGRDDHR